MDTGATTTLINSQILDAIGFTEKNIIDNITFTTGSGKEKANLLKAKSINALGVKRANFKVISHQLPITTYVDGLLGIDFFKEKKLTIDFLKGEITTS